MSAALETARFGPAARPASAAERARCVELLRSELVRRQARWRQEDREALCPTGWEAADMLLQGGFARGRVSAVAGTEGAGASTLVAGAVAQATRAGAPCAWVDTAATLDPAGLAACGATLERVLRVRAPPAEAEWAARLLARCGAFALVAADWPAGPTSEPVLARLSEAARTGRTALVLLGPGAAGLPVALRVRLEVQLECGPPDEPLPGVARRRIGPPAPAGLRRTVRLVRERSRGGSEASGVVSLPAPEPEPVPVRPPPLPPRRTSGEPPKVGGALEVVPFTDRLYSRPARHRDPPARTPPDGGAS